MSFANPQRLKSVVTRMKGMMKFRGSREGELIRVFGWRGL
jgi:hypothetical protein